MVRGFTYQPRILRTRIKKMTRLGNRAWKSSITNTKMQPELRWGGEDTWSTVKQF